MSVKFYVVFRKREGYLSFPGGQLELLFRNFK